MIISKCAPNFVILYYMGTQWDKPDSYTPSRQQPPTSKQKKFFVTLVVL